MFLQNTGIYLQFYMAPKPRERHRRRRHHHHHHHPPHHRENLKSQIIQSIF
jgi:hypothetical protein